MVRVQGFMNHADNSQSTYPLSCQPDGKAKADTLDLHEH